MKKSFCAITNGRETIYVNPTLVRYFESNGPGETAIVFDEEHSLKIKASLIEVEKMLSIQ